MPLGCRKSSDFRHRTAQAAGPVQAIFGGVARPTRLGVLNSSPYAYQKAVSLVLAKALEDAGVLSWVHRLKRVRVVCPDLFGGEGVRVVPQRTSNGYHFFDPSGASLPKSERPTGTTNQGYFSSLRIAFGDERTARNEREGAFRGGARSNVSA